MAFAINIENWRLVDGYDNYEISSHGRTRNNISGKILSPGLSGRYKRVNFYKDGKVKQYLVHRLVAFAFCENPNNYEMVDHMDRNKTNNMFNNLRWCTSSENNRNKTKARNNTSGTQGISKDRNSWKAQWTDNESVMYSKYFSIKTYGEDQAKILAIAHRKAKELEFGYL